VTGVTFDKADEAFAEGAKLRARAETAKGLSGAELAAESAELVRLLETAVVPAAERKQLMDTIGDLRKKIVEEEKAKMKANQGAAKAEAEALAEGVAGPFVAKLLDTEADAKVLEVAVNAITAKLPEAAVLLIGKSKALAVLAVVPTALQAKISAADWMNKALQAAGGKGGGKSGRAQGQSKDPTNAAEAEAAALAYAEGQLS